MARKKKGIGKILGSITGTPYERMIRQIEKVEQENEGQDLSRELNKLAKVVKREFEEGRVDAEEHDLVLEEIESIHPDGRTFDKLDTDEDQFYDNAAMPDAPELELGGPINLDSLMQSKSDSFQGSWGSDEYDDYKRQMTEEFYRESDEAISGGDHEHLFTGKDPTGRVFHDVEATADDVKREILIEQGVDVDGEDEEPDHYFDDDGVEWWRDDEGQWWYRPVGDEDWYPWDE